MQRVSAGRLKQKGSGSGRTSGLSIIIQRLYYSRMSSTGSASKETFADGDGSMQEKKREEKGGPTNLLSSGKFSSIIIYNE